MNKKESELLISVLSKVVGISKSNIEKLINENGTAKFFLQQEKALAITSSLENLKILTRFILFRDYGDLSRLKQKDIDFINNNYNIKIDYSEILQREDYSTIEIIDLFEEERNIQKNMRISTIEIRL